jgi:hypothetical protein
MKLLKRMRENIEKIAKATHSKKLNDHLDMMVAQAMEGCTTLNEISALTKVDKCLHKLKSAMCGEQDQRLPNIRVDIL